MWGLVLVWMNGSKNKDFSKATGIQIESGMGMEMDVIVSIVKYVPMVV